MIEVPSAAILADKLAPLVDFFSIGTNDLTQYTLAADRTNVAVAHFNDSYHPAVLRLIKTVVDAAHKNGKWVGICGEIASEPLATAILIGLSVDELSINIPSILEIKKRIIDLDYSNCKLHIEEILNMSNAGEVRRYLAKHLDA
jgi:phosphoenolpyruvate-protein kinase (PTS system EI component)